MPASNPIGATRESVSGPSQRQVLTDSSQELPDDEHDTTLNNDNSFGNFSETETLAPSSPELPPLTAPARVGFTPRTPQADLSSGSAFYTASWGSPYDISSLPAGRHSAANHRRAASALSLDDLNDIDEDEEDSPHIAFGLSHLIPSRLTVPTFDITPTRPSTPTGWSPTQDTPRITAVNIIDPEAVKVPPRDLFATLSKIQKSGSGERSSSQRFGLQDFNDTGSATGKIRSVKGHRSHSTNRTLRQEDIIATTTSTTAATKMDSSKYATSSPRARSGSVITPTKASAAPAAAPAPQHDWAVNTAPGPPVLLDRGTSNVSNISTTSLREPRSRRRVIYKGKSCWITLPTDPPRGGDGEAPKPMSARDIAERLKKFQDEGFDTAGFDHENNAVPHPIQTLAARTQTCAVFPLPVEKDSVGKGPNPAVQIPDIRQWQAYVRELKEAKLRALGVSLGDDPSDPPPTLSRVPSSQFSGLPFSPPLPPSSAGSQRMGPGGSMYPLGFIPGSSNHTSTRSIASPMSSLSNPRQSMHMHRQSMFISPPLSHQNAISPQGFQSWSPQPFGFNNVPISASSPGLSSGAADMRSPISPFNGFMDGPAPFQFPQRAELVAQLQSQKQQQMLRQSQILPMRPASTLAEVPEAETEEEVGPSTTRSVPPELFNPRPGHRHNISEKLEENVGKSFNLEKSHEPTLPNVEDDGKSPIEEKPDSTSKPSVPEWRRSAAPAVVSDTLLEKDLPNLPTAESPALPIQERKDGVGRTYALEYNSEAETNPSDFGFSSPAQPKMDTSTTSNPWENDPTFQRKGSDSNPYHDKKHSSKLSLTGLNVAAKEFKFNPRANPAAIFNPSIFSASSFGFKPESVQPFVPRSSIQTKAVSPPSFAKSLNTPSKPKFNIDAPEFSPSGFGSSALSNSEFVFASGPVLKPTAPAFEPGAPSIVSDGVFGASTASDADRLFGSVNFNEFANHGKKSKAVEIVAPEFGDESDPELHEDEDGRVGQGFAKRTRRGADDGDSVPLFAMPDPLASEFVPKTAEPAFETKTIEQDFNTKTVEPDFDVKTVEPREVELDSEPEEGEIIEDGEILEDGEIIEDEPADKAKDELEDAEAGADEDDSLFDILSGKVPESALGFSGRDLSPFKESNEFASDETIIQPHVSSLVQKSVASPDEIPSTPIATQMDDSTQLTPRSASDEEDKVEDASEQLISPPSSAIASKLGLDADYPADQQDESTLSSPLRKLPSSVRYYDDLEQPTFQEIDAIMQQFNEADSDFGVERELPSWPETSPGSLPTLRPTLLPANLRSDAPSPSPRHQLLNLLPQDLDSASVTQDPFSDTRAVNGYESPIRRLNEEDTIPVSDWNDFSSADEDIIRANGPFLDSHVSEVINSTLGKRLGPLEKQLQAIQSTMTTLSTARAGRRAQSRATMDSDADDEDDEVITEFNSRAWSRSPMRDRKVERMRAVIQEALSNHRPQADPLSGAMASSVILDALNDMKIVMTAQIAKGLQEDNVKSAVDAALLQRNIEPSNVPQLEDIRAAVEAAVSTHIITADSSRTLAGDESAILSELLQKNAEAVAKAAEESEARKTAERRDTESSRLLKLAEEELALLRATVKDNEVQLAAHGEKSRSAEQRAVVMETSSADSQAKITDLSEMNIALKATVEEYRLSHDKWRADIESLNREKEKLAGISGMLKMQAEEAVRIRQTMGARLEKLSTDTAAATGKLADERAKWQAADSEYRSRLNYWKDKAEAERVTRENFERKIEGIEALDRENMKLRHLLEHVSHEKGRLQADVDTMFAKERESQKMTITFEHLQKENSKLEEIVDKLRNESQQHEQSAEKYAREWREARDNGQQDLQRTRILLQTEIEAANSHANILRAGLEGEISRLRSELESARMDVDAARAKEELILEQEADSKRDAIREVIDGKTTALAEQKLSYEERVEQLRRQHRRDLDHVIENKNQSETFLREAHAQRLADMEQQNQRSLEQAYEDKERTEAYLSERLAVADSKIELLEDRITHLTSKVQTAQSAAQAAAQLAQSTRGVSAPQAPMAMPSMTGGLGGASSAALRESLQVMHDQLQERQSRIESLESEIAEVDDTLPEKIRARDIEVGWLRELLGVRMDDLSELCDLLDRDDYDREAVRNAAIRIKTGLKMNIQERERKADNTTPLSAGASNLATSIQNFATPRAAQLARVIGEWRSTPARRSSQSSSGFLSGLMTPPASNVRRTPEPPNTVELRRGSSASVTARLNIGQPLSSRQQEKSRVGFPALSLKEPLLDEPPRTPPLLHARAYDDDAEAGAYSADGFYDDEDSTIDGTPRRMRDRLES
jgi:hypothetical protein